MLICSYLNITETFNYRGRGTTRQFNILSCKTDRFLHSYIIAGASRVLNTMLA